MVDTMEEVRENMRVYEELRKTAFTFYNNNFEIHFEGKEDFLVYPKTGKKIRLSKYNRNFKGALTRMCNYLERTLRINNSIIGIALEEYVNLLIQNRRGIKS